ncbi:hypothetical protein H2200_012168 [Cladophialophora chaetospira]|uniref:Uncharacterized protein n=1 Tax=Cladophialophora chaetospira TaxID=386627 RepID=A0AA38WYB6_9EURO|nr:hypothetical protein H2200_012168 [Cladophialophora chaetospira]
MSTYTLTVKVEDQKTRALLRASGYSLQLGTPPLDQDYADNPTTVLLDGSSSGKQTKIQGIKAIKPGEVYTVSADNNSSKAPITNAKTKELYEQTGAFAFKNEVPVSATIYQADAPPAPTDGKPAAPQTDELLPGVKSRPTKPWVPGSGKIRVKPSDIIWLWLGLEDDDDDVNAGDQSKKIPLTYKPTDLDKIVEYTLESGFKIAPKA